jgi:hypothetical protein
MVLWVHETTPTTKAEAATFYIKSRAAGFINELCLLERTVEHTVNAFGICV